MLIIALGVLTLMAILGAAFASLIRLEKRATENYIDAKRMDLLLDSALDRVIAQLQGGKNFRSFSTSIYRDVPWFYLVRPRAGQPGDDLANGRVDLDDPRVGKWDVFTDRAGQIYSYKTKVLECAAQINLNGRQDTIARMIDNLGAAIEKSARLKLDGKHVVNPLYEKPRRGGNPVYGRDIVQLRRQLPEARFTTKSQLRLLIGPENFDVLKDFVTVSSWEDETTYKASDGVDEVPNLAGGGTTTSGGGLGGSGNTQRQEAAYGVPRLDPEPRHPININTAPEEVLIACFQGLAGRRVFPYSRLGSGGSMQPINQGATIQGDRVIGSEEYRDITPRAVFVYTPRLEYDHAQKLATRVISQRKQKPFMAWRTNDPSQPGFEDFIDSLDSSFFPSPQNCQAIDPDKPADRQVEAQIIRGGATEIGRLWVKGTGQSSIRQTRTQLGLSFHEQYAWYYDMIKGAIKANFNPNSRINRYNCNTPAFIASDKSDLVWLKDRFNRYKGHTTEFCFDSMGIYEVTGLGQITEKGRDRAAPSTTVGPADPTAGGRPSFTRQTRTVVKIFDVLRHTNQFQFEKTFQSGSRSSKNDRKYVVTWPEPMGALTELVSSGTVRDGRVELAGVLDGRRLEAPIGQRTQLLSKFPSIVMAHTFQDRTSDQLSRLQRATQQGSKSLLGDEYTEAVRAVLNPPYSRLQPQQNARYVSRKEILAMGGQANQDAQIYDPLVGKEVLGTDLFPDGLNASLYRQAHLQARVLLVPARQRIGSASSGGGNPQFGASGRGSRSTNVLGNVPYSKGGIAFWVKFDFDGDDPVFSGLLGCTQVIKEVSPAASDFQGSEGTQFFIFKNSKGQLRVVRMYYHQAFLAESGGEGGASGGGDSGNGIRLYPDPGVSGADSGGAGATQNPILQELDPKKIISRADTTPVDVSHFRAHEWHHIAIDWNDEVPVGFPKLYIDFQEMKEATPRYAQAQVDTTANSWVRLNERQPRDGLQIGGIVRDQGVADAGVFKWFTNTTATNGGVQVVAQATKRLLANATIDELVCYDSTFTGVKQYYGAAGSPGYFSSQPGEYANLFEIPMPADVDSVTLRSFDWTSYYPTTYTDSRVNSVPQRLQVTPMQCELTYNAGNAATPSAFFEPWRQPTVQNQVSGRILYRQQKGLKGNNGELTYKFRLTGSRAATGNTAGGVVQTPVIDDVTLTYFLPSPKILTQEDLD